MSEPLNVSNTLVNQPVNYIGHNPYQWKWIGKWDSDTFQKDFYTDEMTGLQQYDLVCGQGVSMIDEIGGNPIVCCDNVPKKKKITINFIKRHFLGNIDDPEQPIYYGGGGYGGYGGMREGEEKCFVIEDEGYVGETYTKEITVSDIFDYFSLSTRYNNYCSEYGWSGGANYTISIQDNLGNLSNIEFYSQPSLNTIDGIADYSNELMQTATVDYRDYKDFEVTIFYLFLDSYYYTREPLTFYDFSQYYYGKHLSLTIDDYSYSITIPTWYGPGNTSQSEDPTAYVYENNFRDYIEGGMSGGIDFSELESTETKNLRYLLAHDPPTCLPKPFNYRHKLNTSKEGYISITYRECEGLNYIKNKAISIIDKYNSQIVDAYPYKIDYDRSYAKFPFYTDPTDITYDPVDLIDNPATNNTYEYSTPYRFHTYEPSQNYTNIINELYELSIYEIEDNYVMGNIYTAYDPVNHSDINWTNLSLPANYYTDGHINYDNDRMLIDAKYFSDPKITVDFKLYRWNIGSGGIAVLRMDSMWDNYYFNSNYTRKRPHEWLCTGQAHTPPGVSSPGFMVFDASIPDTFISFKLKTENTKIDIDYTKNIDGFDSSFPRWQGFVDYILKNPNFEEWFNYVLNKKIKIEFTIKGDSVINIYYDQRMNSPVIGR